MGHGQSGAPGPAQLVCAVGSRAVAAPLRNPGQLDVVGHRLLRGTGEAGLLRLAAEQPPEGAVQEETVPAA